MLSSDADCQVSFAVKVFGRQTHHIDCRPSVGEIVLPKYCNFFLLFVTSLACGISFSIYFYLISTELLLGDCFSKRQHFPDLFVGLIWGDAFVLRDACIAQIWWSYACETMFSDAISSIWSFCLCNSDEITSDTSGSISDKEVEKNL